MTIIQTDRKVYALTFEEHEVVLSSMASLLVLMRRFPNSFFMWSLFSKTINSLNQLAKLVTFANFFASWYPSCQLCHRILASWLFLNWLKGSSLKFRGSLLTLSVFYSESYFLMSSHNFCWEMFVCNWDRQWHLAFLNMEGIKLRSKRKTSSCRMKGWILIALKI